MNAARRDCFGRVLGVVLFAHFAAIAAIKIHHGANEDIWWLSHVSLAVAGAGYLLRSHRFIAIACIAVMIPHTAWLVDCAVGLLTQSFPLGITSYIARADLPAWVATAHHFYLLPILVCTVCRARIPVIQPLLIASVLFIALTLVSRGAFSPGRNVNCAYAIFPRLDSRWIRWTDHLSPMTYLCVLNSAVILLCFAPSACVIRVLSGRPHGAGQADGQSGRALPQFQHISKGGSTLSPHSEHVHASS